MRKTKIKTNINRKALFLMLFSATSMAAITDLANAPLATSSTTSVLPNLMFVLDASGSMDWDFLPDSVGNVSTSPSYNCKNSSGGLRACDPAEPPYYSSDYNKIYYNPNITYTPAVDPDSSLVGASVSRPSQGNPWTNVIVDSFDTTVSRINLVGNYPDVEYCKSNLSACKRNSTYTYPDSTYNVMRTAYGSPFYYSIAPKEYCDSASLISCTLATSPSGSYIYPAPVRHCQKQIQATASTAQSGSSGGSPKCQLKYDSNHKYLRYGTFSRTDIVSSTTTYTGRFDRKDCAGNNTTPGTGICTYSEEMTNFANWYTYYRTRMQMMKTTVGQAFIPIDAKYRVGFITINPGSPVSNNKYLSIAKFDIPQKTAWYQKLYAQQPTGGTPLREALSRVGRHFGGITTGINSGMTPDPMEYSCQQNFTILTTDGYWNGNAGIDLSGSVLGNQDNTDSGYTTRSIGAYDPNPVPSGDNNSLADVAAYYYKTDLRATGSTGVLGTDVSQDNVPATNSDPNTAQHMTTFTVGLADGKMLYQPHYDTDANGDFYLIKSSSTGCSWQSSGTCNWPYPARDQDTALDDLWHAAVNGHGRYYNAKDPTSLSAGIEGALANVSAKRGAAAAAATSSPNVTQSDNAIFSTTYRTVKWDGEVQAQTIDTNTGQVLSAVSWTAQAQLDAKAAANQRLIYAYSASTASKLRALNWSNLNTSEQAFFNNKGSTMDQYGGLTVAQRATADNGQNLLNYILGDRSQESPAAIYRARDHVFGDTVTATPAYVRSPTYNFGDSGYSTFKSSQSTRQAMLYIAANDGMLHALNATTGSELWSYVPTAMLSKLYKLADDGYPTKHEYFVDGSPETMDVYIGNTWKTILVGGFNAGGRGYYALDITDPANPKGLWEFCHSSSICANHDSNVGYSYGNPVITKDIATGKWVVIVTSGHNNISPGDGKGYFYVLDAADGSILRTYATGSGTTTTPSGLSKMSAWADHANDDNTALRLYAGDMNGDVWRVDLTGTIGGSNPFNLANLRDSSGNSQPVTTKPELGVCNYQKMVYIGTGRYLGISDLSNISQQSIYGFKDALNTTALGNLQASSSMIQQTVTQATPSSTSRGISYNAVNILSDSGWYLNLPTAGERVNVDPQLVLGTLLVASNIPNSNACNAGGDSWQYQLDFCSGSYLSTAPNQTVATKMGNEMTAGFVIVSLPSGALKQIVTGTTGSQTTLGVNVGGNSGTAKRVSWREIF